MYGLYNTKEQAYVNTVIDGKIILCDWITRKEFKTHKEASSYLYNECASDVDNIFIVVI